MYDISTRNVKKGKNIYVVFFAVGFIFLAFLVYQTYATHQKEASLDSSTTSTRVEITLKYTPHNILPESPDCLPDNRKSL